MANERRLIDADKLIDSLYDNEFAVLCPLDEVSAVIDNLPTVDAVEVVRCKDCKHFEGGEFLFCRHKRGLTQFVKPTDFCSYGEKREVE